MGQERRRGVRSTTKLIAFVKNPTTGKVKRWLTKDVSGFGLCLLADESLERGTHLEVELKLPDYPSPIVTTAEVIWVMTVEAPRRSFDAPKVELGITFVDLPPKVQALLNQYAVMTAPPSEPHQA